MHLLVVDLATGPLTRAGRQLRERFRWRVGFAEGGAGCLDELATHRWDAVVAGHRVHDMDGVSLLALVRRRQPDAVRLLVDRPGAPVQDLGVPAGIVHEVLHEVPSASSLRAVLTALESTPDQLPAPLRAAIAEVAALPAVQLLLLELRDLADRGDVTTADLTALIGREPRLAAGVVALASSGFAGSTTLDRLDHAAELLGVATLPHVAVAAAALSAVARPDVDPALVAQARQHGIAAARLAAGMPGLCAHARTGALLLDVGLPLMALAFGDAHADLRRRARAGEAPLHVLEAAELGATHAQAGALLARRWSLPTEVCQMIASHHLPPVGREQDPRAVGYAVHRAVQTTHGIPGVDPYDTTSRADVVVAGDRSTSAAPAGPDRAHAPA